MYLASVARHLMLLRGLGFVADALDGARISWVAMKGPVLSELIYRRSDLRSYNDLDVLVAPTALQAALAALERSGGRLLDANWRLIAETVPAELHVAMPDGGVLDLHWHVVCERQVRRRVHVPTAGLLARSRRESIGGRQIPVLDPVDTLVHLAVHASLSGADRLGWLQDVEQCILRWPPDWPAVVQRARAGGASVATAVVLGRARAALGAPVPDGVLRDLVPSAAWRRLLAATDSIWPVPRLSAGGSPARLLARAARDDVRVTLAEATRRTLAWVRSGGRLEPLDRDRDLDATFGGSLLHPAGTVDQREAYFTAATTESVRM